MRSVLGKVGDGAVVTVAVALLYWRWVLVAALALVALDQQTWSALVTCAVVGGFVLVFDR